MLWGFPLWETWRMQSQKDKFCHCFLVQMQTKNLLLSPPNQEDLQTWHFKEVLSIGLSNVGNYYIKKFISLTGGLSHEFAISYVGFKVPHMFIASKVLPAVRVKQEIILIVLFTLFLLLKQNVSCFSLLVCRLLEDLLILVMAVAF